MDLAGNFKDVRERIEAACARSKRDPRDIILVAVTKSHPPEVVAEVVELGHLLFGENKVQEAKAKIPLCPGRARWHMIGHLQSNKARDAVALFEMIESVDSLSLAHELQKWAEKQAKTIPVLLEVIVAGESSKFGYNPDRLLGDLAALNALSKIEVHGLMTIAPWTREPEKVRPAFRKMCELKKK